MQQGPKSNTEKGGKNLSWGQKIGGREKGEVKTKERGVG